MRNDRFDPEIMQAIYEVLTDWDDRRVGCEAALMEAIYDRIITGGWAFYQTVTNDRRRREEARARAWKIP